MLYWSVSVQIECLHNVPKFIVLAIVSYLGCFSVLLPTAMIDNSTRKRCQVLEWHGNNDIVMDRNREDRVTGLGSV